MCKHELIYKIVAELNANGISEMCHIDNDNGTLMWNHKGSEVEESAYIVELKDNTYCDYYKTISDDELSSETDDKLLKRAQTIVRGILAEEGWVISKKRYVTAKEMDVRVLIVCLAILTYNDIVSNIFKYHFSDTWINIFSCIQLIIGTCMILVGVGVIKTTLLTKCRILLVFVVAACFLLAIISVFILVLEGIFLGTVSKFFAICLGLSALMSVVCCKTYRRVVILV